jgi:predicted HAD superfamily Cof-like phosphohydrolase
MTPAEMVTEFHRAFALPIRHTPQLGDASETALRAALIREECREAREALHQGDLVGVAQELADVVYVAYGTAIQFGIDLDAVISAVHAANMSKLGEDGQPVRRADGKILKGAGFQPADVAAVLR